MISSFINDLFLVLSVLFRIPNLLQMYEVFSVFATFEELNDFLCLFLLRFSKYPLFCDCIRNCLVKFSLNKRLEK